MIFNVGQPWDNIGVQHWNNIKSFLLNVDATIFQRCTMCFNVDMILSQRCFNVAWTSVNAISKPIWVVESMNLQKIDKFYSNKWENIM